MPLRKQKFSLKFIQGVDGKIDHKLLPVESLTTLENGRFDKLGAINKRKGWSTVTGASGSDLVQYRNSVIARNSSLGDRISSGTTVPGQAYAVANDSFDGDVGYSEGIDYTYLPVSRGSEYQQLDSQVALSSDGKYACITFVNCIVVWDGSISGGDYSGTPKINFEKRVSIVDRENNALLASDILIGTLPAGETGTHTGQEGRRMRPIWLNSKFYIFGEDNGFLKFWIIDPTESTIAVKNAGGSADTDGTSLGFVANTSGNVCYPLVQGGSSGTTPAASYTLTGASFDICSSSTATKAHLFTSMRNGSIYTNAYYVFTTATHNLINATTTHISVPMVYDIVTGETLKGHHSIHRAATVTGTHANKLSFSSQMDANLYIFGADEEETGGLNSWDRSVTIALGTGLGGAARTHRGVFVDDIDTGTDDVKFIAEIQNDILTPGVANSGGTAIKVMTGVHGSGSGFGATPPVELNEHRLVFALGNTPETVGVIHQDSPGEPASGVWIVADAPVSTIALMDNDTDTTKSDGYWHRDNLPIGTFLPEFMSDILKSDIVTGATDAWLNGAAVAIPLGTNFQTHNLQAPMTSTQLVLNSTTHLFDFRRHNEERVDIPVPSSAMLNDVLYVADKGLFQFDGVQFRLLGFPDRPSLGIKLNAATGLDQSSVYYYKAVYEWTDAQGNLHQSTPSAAANITTDASGDESAEIRVVPFAEVGDIYRPNVKRTVYRTQGNGSIYNQLVSSTLSEDEDGAVVSIVDRAADSVVATGKFLYTDSGELANTCPPASARYVVAHRDRLFVIGKDDIVYYSKIVRDGFGVGFNEALLIRTPDNVSDRPTALASMDGNLFIFTEHSIFIVGGEGPDNLGSGGFYEAKRVPTNVGAVMGSPVKLINEGLIFVAKHKTKYGIYLLARNMSITNIGSPIEHLLETSTGVPRVVKDIVVDSEMDSVLFLLSQTSGTPDGVKVLVYNYAMKQWGLDNIEGTYSTSAGGNFAWAAAQGSKQLYLSFFDAADSTTCKLLERNALYVDNSTYVPLKIKTAWVNLAGIQSYQRVYNFHILGEAIDAHTLTINVYYDYDDDTIVDTYSHKTTSAGLLQIRGHLSKQKCQAIQFEVLDADNSGTIDGGFSISEIALEVGMKTDTYKDGNVKLSGTATIGSNS